MREIPLTKGQVALIDDEDLYYLNQWNWHAIKAPNTYYAVRKTRKSEGDKKTLLMHRELLKVTSNLLEVDHINHNGLHNYKKNLRTATHGENLQNRRGLSVKNTT